MTPNMLEPIVASTRGSLAQREGLLGLSQVESLAVRAGPARGFKQALLQSGMSLIAEVKRASPSKGPLNLDLDVAAQADAYARGGAAAISVLTEPRFFKGSFQDLETARRTVTVPVLCKDFILSAYQVFEARMHGADAVLLIAAVLAEPDLRSLRELAERLGMDALVEIHDREEAQAALAAGASLIGINNRDLTDFTVDICTSLKLRPLLPASVVVVSESGIGSRGAVELLEQAGVNAVLVGESLVKSGDPAGAVRKLLGR